jgi:hypothetical protein
MDVHAGEIIDDQTLHLGESSVPGRIVTFSTKIGILGPWKRDLAI